MLLEERWNIMVASSFCRAWFLLRLNIQAVCLGNLGFQSLQSPAFSLFVAIVSHERGAPVFVEQAVVAHFGLTTGTIRFELQDRAVRLVFGHCFSVALCRVRGGSSGVDGNVGVEAVVHTTGPFVAASWFCETFGGQQHPFI